ncbi:MAG: adenylyl-sulfate kinase [Candidatus Omnitrophica bacterium]|nr:adenylyl-sulfate kinase [Candidatus Omnitrophota bacterium]
MSRRRPAKKPFVLWFTGLPCSGKTTLADRIYKDLKKKDLMVEKLDGDVVRGIFPRIGFSRDERNEHVRNTGFLSSMLERNGIITIASFVSPYRESRNFVRNLCENFIEIYVDTSVEECERRDVKGMYKMARLGKIKNFTGIDDPYEAPETPEIVVHAEQETVDESLSKIEDYIQRYL